MFLRLVPRPEKDEHPSRGRLYSYPSPPSTHDGGEGVASTRRMGTCRTAVRHPTPLYCRCGTHRQRCPARMSADRYIEVAADACGLTLLPALWPLPPRHYASSACRFETGEERCVPGEVIPLTRGTVNAANPGVACAWGGFHEAAVLGSPSESRTDQAPGHRRQPSAPSRPPRHPDYEVDTGAPWATEGHSVKAGYRLNGSTGEGAAVGLPIVSE